MTLSKEEQLYRIANHIASTKGGLTEEWQPWADEMESDLRRLVSQERDKQEPVAYDQTQRDHMKDILIHKLSSNLTSAAPLVMADIHACTMALMQAGFRAAPQPLVVPECFARFHEVVNERHHGRMPEEVQKVFDECAVMLQSFGNSEQLPEPVADVVAWHKEGEERTCDIRWRRFDVAPGPLFTRPLPPGVPDGYCIMPLKLTAANGAKAALSGEFHVNHHIVCEEGCESCNEEGGWKGEILIGWDTIKRIHKAAVEACALPESDNIG